MARILTALALSTSLALAARADTVSVVDAGTFQLEALAPQKIDKGRCALFLWSRSDQPQFILYVTDKPARAKLRVNGKDREIARGAVSGASAFNHFEHQSFSGSGVAFDLDLTFDEAKPVRDGVVVKTGALRTRAADGVETVLPVGGMIGCEAG